MKTRADLEKAYEQLFASFETLEKYLKNSNAKDIHAANLHSLDLLNKYTDNASELGYSTASLHPAFDTLLDLNNNNLPDIKAQTTALGKITDLIWSFHAATVEAKETAYSSNQEIRVLNAAEEVSVSSLPDDVKRLICDYLPNGSDSFNLLRSSLSLFAPINNTIVQREDHPLRKLLSHGALGELEAAETFWSKDPTLLCCYGTIYHPNHIYIDEAQASVGIPFHMNPGTWKYVNRTFYQILLSNSEFEEAENVGEKMTLQEKRKQFYEVFPDGEIKKYNFDLEHAKTLLQNAFDAVARDETLGIEHDQHGNITNIKMSGATQIALYKLYLYAKPKSEHETGLVFDPEFYLEALKLYDEKSSTQFKKKWDAYTTWNIFVEEWLAGCLGTGYLRPHSQGLGNTLTRRGCDLGNKSSYFAFRRVDHSISGFLFFVDYHGDVVGGGWRKAHRVVGLFAQRAIARFETYVKQKQEQGETLRGNLHRATKHLHV